MSMQQSIGSRTTPPRAFAAFLLLELGTSLLLLRHDLSAAARSLIIGVHIVVGFVVLTAVVVSVVRFLGRRRDGWPWDLIALLISGIVAAGFGADRDFPLVSATHAAAGAYVLVRRLLPRRAGFLIIPIVTFLFAQASFRQTGHPRVEDVHDNFPSGPIDGPYPHGYVDASRLSEAGGERFVDVTRCTMCHNEIVQAHGRSAHRHASVTNPYYTESIRSLAVAKGKAATTACAGCHDIGLVATGTFPDGILSPGAAASLPPGADIGVPCLACHGATNVNGDRGNGALTLQLPRDPLVTSDGLALFLQKLLTYADPRAHREAMMPRGSDTSGRCGVCHQAFLHEGINGALHTRGQTERDDHRQSAFYPQSGASGRLALGAPRTCRDCHMRRQAYGDGHQMLGANTALPHLFGDNDWLKQTQHVLAEDGALTVRIFLVDDERVVLAGDAPFVPDGKTEVHVLVQNRRTGHAQFGGTKDTHDVVVQLILDDHGTPRPVIDEGPHRLGVEMLDSNGETVRGHITEQLHTPLYHHTLKPGYSHIVRYRVAATSPAKGFHIGVNILHRKFAPAVSRRVGAPTGPLTRVGKASTLAPSLSVDEQAKAYAAYATAAGTVWEDARGKSALAAAAALNGVGPQAAFDVTLSKARFALDREHDRKAAIQLLEAAQDDDGADARGTALLARALVAAGQPDAANTLYASLLKDFAYDAELHISAAQAARRAGDADAALARVLRVLELEPDHFGALVMLTALYGERGDIALVKSTRAAAERVRPARDATAAALKRERRDSVAAREADRHHVHDVRVNLNATSELQLPEGG